MVKLNTLSFKLRNVADRYVINELFQIIDTKKNVVIKPRDNSTSYVTSVYKLALNDKKWTTFQESYVRSVIRDFQLNGVR